MEIYAFGGEDEHIFCYFPTLGHQLHKRFFKGYRMVNTWAIPCLDPLFSLQRSMGKTFKRQESSKVCKTLRVLLSGIKGKLRA